MTEFILSVLLLVLVTLACLVISRDRHPRIERSQRHEPRRRSAVAVSAQPTGTAPAKLRPAAARQPQPPPRPDLAPRPSVSVSTVRTPQAIVTRTGTNSTSKPLVDPYTAGERAWSAYEDQRLLDLYWSGSRIREMAADLVVDQKQVAVRLIRMLLAPEGQIDNDDAMMHARTRYAESEVAELVRALGAGVPVSQLALRVGRSQLGVGWKLLDLGVVPAPRRAGDETRSTWAAPRRYRAGTVGEPAPRRPAPSTGRAKSRATATNAGLCPTCFTSLPATGTCDYCS